MSSRFKKIFAMTLGSIFLLICVLAASLSLWLDHCRKDVPLTPEAVALFQHRDVFRTKDNLVVDWAGLGAPPGTQDLHAYGLKAVLSHRPGDDYNINAFANQSGFKIQTSRLCTVEADIRARHDCLRPADIEKLYRDNAEFMGRYLAFSSKTHEDISFGDQVIIQGLNMQMISDAQTLLAAHWIEQARRGHTAEAMDAWLENTRFIQHVMGGKMNAIGQAVWQVAYTKNLGVLPILLQQDKRLIPVYKEHVAELFNKDYRKIWNIKATLLVAANFVYDMEDNIRAKHLPLELESGKPASWGLLFYRTNDVRNRVASYVIDAERVSEQPLADMHAMADAVEKKYKYPLHFWSVIDYDVIGKQMLAGISHEVILIPNLSAKVARQRALILWMNAMERNIPASEMPRFLSAADSSLDDPVTGKPFLWDAEQKAIIFNMPGASEPVYLVYYDSAPYK